MRSFSVNYGSIVSFRIEAEIPGYHKKEWNGETADRVHGNAHSSGKLTVHENHTKTGYSLDEIQASIIMLHPTNNKYKLLIALLL